MILHKQYKVTLEGLSPLLMHRDNIDYSNAVQAWRKAPENKAGSVAGDDHSPPWTWIGYVYHDDKNIGLNCDNLMTMLREGATKVRTGKGTETFKKQSQSGIIIEHEQWDIDMGAGSIPIEPFRALVGNTDFNLHKNTAVASGFQLFTKRVKIGRSKHIRIRPMFSAGWKVTGTLLIIDEEMSGITMDILTTILKQAGALCGIGDWRPSSPQSSGTFGRFSSTVELVA